MGFVFNLPCSLKKCNVFNCRQISDIDNMKLNGGQRRAFYKHIFFILQNQLNVDQ